VRLQTYDDDTTMMAPQMMTLITMATARRATTSAMMATARRATTTTSMATASSVGWWVGRSFGR
jgi:hypothetical protein